MSDSPGTPRDVIVKRPDNSEAFGYYMMGGWKVYPNIFPCNPLDLNIFYAVPGTVVSWREIEQVYA